MTDSRHRTEGGQVKSAKFSDKRNQNTATCENQTSTQNRFSLAEADRSPTSASSELSEMSLKLGDDQQLTALRPRPRSEKWSFWAAKQHGMSPISPVLPLESKKLDTQLKKWGTSSLALAPTEC